MNQLFSALGEMRDATNDVHARLEKTLRIAAPGAGRDDYLAYIAALWGWLSPFEEKLWSAPWPHEMQAALRNGKRAWIEADLQSAHAIDLQPGDIPVCGFSPDLDSVGARFGVAYVIEGAQLGTLVLSKTLSPVLAPWSPRWLQGYGETTGMQWRTFMQCAESCLDSDSARGSAARSARQAFLALESWFKERAVA